MHDHRQRRQTVCLIYLSVRLVRLLEGKTRYKESANGSSPSGPPILTSAHTTYEQLRGNMKLSFSILLLSLIATGGIASGKRHRRRFSDEPEDGAPSQNKVDIHDGWYHIYCDKQGTWRSVIDEFPSTQGACLETTYDLPGNVHDLIPEDLEGAIDGSGKSKSHFRSLSSRLRQAR